MTQFLFSITFLVAVPFWALMILAPKWGTTAKVIASPLVVVPPALIYLVLAIANLPELWAAVSAPALGPLAEFLGTPEGTALGWAHFIAWDLFVGRWMYRQSRELDIHPLVMAPILLVTILASPIGLLLFLPVRALWARREEPAPTVSP
ncbi:ABA4-like family protein [Umezawaea endophytica]|uniref:ABA4-like family protein n=1 Tax=Umezawaea endophytica TaxID=1654476 RepID=A0A9X2VUT3_9PSEU|nr:ABA4-like family protein [Umezawaea endophytica]MCS7482742.1 ABA4-like family protein [Umezawaea endophytica]